MTSALRVHALYLFLPHMLLAASALPATDETSVESPAVAEQLKALRDQTNIRSRVWIDTEWDQFDRGAEKAKWTLAGL